jgi:hypothetical protein
MHMVCPKSSLETNLGDFKSLKITTKRLCFFIHISPNGSKWDFKNNNNKNLLMHTKAPTM